MAGRWFFTRWLDEVREKDNCRILKQIRDFDQFKHKSIRHNLPDCHEYTFEQFTSWGCRFWCPADPALQTNVYRSVKDSKFIQRLKENEYSRTATIHYCWRYCAWYLKNQQTWIWVVHNNKSRTGAPAEQMDTNRNIERDQVYKKLSVQHKKLTGTNCSDYL